MIWTNESTPLNLRYGAFTAASITLNMPRGQPLAEAALSLYCLDIFLSYPLQFYVIMDIIGPTIIQPAVSDTLYPYVDFLTRQA